ncbi:MAG TPA: sugar ABC transporter ATP-binding protein [Bryobacteraceae bacterium]|nr:sugar ABC transporter ATP-binding protein [Bryobacteraceae bacterium]
MAELLRVEQVNKRYDGVYALKNAHFNAVAGEVHALMGENGAGKSTLAKIIAGSVSPDSARIFLDGRPVSIAGPLDAQRLGISIIYQELDLFPRLTVAENIVIGTIRFESRAFVDFKELDRFCRPLLAEVGLECSPRERVSALSIGQQQLVAIARALGMRARILLMDEPTSSLFGDSVDTLFRLIAGLKQRGVAVIYVSHKMDEIFRICDRLTVLRDGETIGTRRTADSSVGEVIRLMVGREIGQRTPPKPPASPEVVLAVAGLTARKLRGVSFELRRGEVLGIAGLVGAGRSELGAALFGLDRRIGGEIRLSGKPVAPGSAREAIDLGIGLLPEDRKLQGLMMQMSVTENSTLAVLGRLQRFGFVRVDAERNAVEPLFRELALKAPSGQAAVSALSGGNQQKVLLAKCLLARPDVLFLDDPTRGIDIAAKEDIYALVEKLAADGKGVILVSSELPELLRCCHRILVMREGRIAAAFDAADATQEKIMSAAALAGAAL